MCKRKIISFHTIDIAIPCAASVGVMRNTVHTCTPHLVYISNIMKRGKEKKVIQQLSVTFVGSVFCSVLNICLYATIINTLDLIVVNSNLRKRFLSKIANKNFRPRHFQLKYYNK